MTVPVVAIDGPSASGKGEVARRVAGALGCHYLESGALYRLVALASLRHGVSGQDEPRLANIAATLPADFSAGRVLLSGADVTDAIHEEACGNRASEVARHPAVRSALLERQRAFRREPGLVAEGRDMGTVVFPDARLKVFLTASVEERARRRYKQLIDKGLHANLAALSRDLAERDARDSARAVAPLVAAHDAVQLDSSDLSLEQVVATVLRWVREGKPAGAGA
ncbi:MAG: cytidylate kinase [Betaproteobacteria bacterium RIFCSPLOWO2_02_FULL_67_19]|nr:MAG: cytidylate kinase [Betaproteobacteria bacterium RIFCSPLOWO2_02_FULL_67_19]